MDAAAVAISHRRAQEKAGTAELIALSQLSPEPACQKLATNPVGLTEDEAARRLKAYGPNLVTREQKPTILQEIWGRTRNPLNGLLLTLATVSYFLGDLRAALVIVIMVVLSVVTAFIQEHRSNEAAARLRAMVKTTASVRRGGPTGSVDFAEVPIETLVPGDVVRLSAGDMIPADLRLLEAKDLFVNQSPLTGEAMPTEKYAHACDRRLDDPFDLPNICFMGANVVSGYAAGVIVRTGAQTFFGQLADEIAGRHVPTAFDQGINRFTLLMIRFIVVMGPLVFLINGLTKHDWLEALLFAVAVAVGLTPEMLPMIVTVNLAKGATAMARAKVIVKRLNAIQNLGAMDVLCTDKTGTLTQDRIILKRCLDIRGEDSERVLHYAYLNSHFQSGLKNLLDVAVLEHVDLHKILGIDNGYQKVDEIPFDFSRRRLSVVVAHGNDKHVLICKGAVEEIFAVATRYEIDGTQGPLDESHFATAKEETIALNEDGFRVIAVAYKEIDNPKAAYSVADERDLTLLGYIAFLDPPKDTARAAIAALAEKGVQVKILTGDNEVITRKICREVKIDPGVVLLGSQVEQLDDAKLAEIADRTTVFAKLTPGAEGAGRARAAPQGPRGRLPRRRHQRQSGAEGRRCRRFGRYGGRHRQGIRGHHPAREEPLGAAAGRDRGTQDLRQHHQIHQDGRKLEFRQHVQRARRQPVPALPADGADPGAHQQSALRFLADCYPDRQCGRGIYRGATPLGHQQHIQVHGVHRADQLDLRLRHLRDDAVRVRRLDQSFAVSDRMVCGIAAHPDAHHPHHPHGTAFRLSRAGQARR